MKEYKGFYLCSKCSAYFTKDALSIGNLGAKCPNCESEGKLISVKLITPIKIRRE